MKKKAAKSHKLLLKTVVWNDKARDYVRGLDQETRMEIGSLLMMLQQGSALGEPQSKPFRSLHQNGFELRIKDKKGAHRIFYVMLVGNKILIPHAFHKKTQKTPQKEIDTAQRRLSALLKKDAK